MRRDKTNSGSEIDVAELALLQKGDDQAWKSFFQKNDQLIKSIISWSKWRLDKHSQEDVAQIVRKEIVSSIGKFRGDSSLTYFIKRICINRIIDEIRSQVRKKRPLISSSQMNQDGEDFELEGQTDDRSDPVHQIIVFERVKTIRKLLDNLEKLCQTAIRDFYFENLSYKEIAKKRGIALNTVGSRLSKCLERLRSQMKKEEYLGEEAP